MPLHISTSVVLLPKERFEEACHALRRGVSLDDGCNDAKFNLGLTLLTIGEFEEGWHFYETRLRLPEKVRSPINAPMWMVIPQVFLVNPFSLAEQALETIFNSYVMYNTIELASSHFVDTQAVDAFI